MPHTTLVTAYLSLPQSPTMTSVRRSRVRKVCSHLVGTSCFLMLIMKQDISKLGKGSDLNLCHLSNASQLGIPSEFMQDPYQNAYPALAENIQYNDQYSAFLDDAEAYDHVGGSNVGSFVADTLHSSTAPMHSIDPLHPSFHLTSQPPHVGGNNARSFVADTIRSSITPTYSIDPLYSSFHPSFQPPQQYTCPTPYPPELGAICNVRAFGPIRWTEGDHGRLVPLGDSVIQASLHLHSHASF